VRLIISGIQVNPGLEESYRTLQVPSTMRATLWRMEIVAATVMLS
jgi:hypothetical protein